MLYKTYGKLGDLMSEHHHSHEHNYENCCSNHTPDNHGCGSCGQDHFNEHKKENIIKIVASAVLFVAGYIAMQVVKAPELKFVYMLCFAVSYMLVGFSVVRNAIEGIIKGRIFDENFLMTFASIGAFVIGEYSEGVAVMLLFAIGEFIQGLAVSKSRESIDSILEQKHQYTLPKHYDNVESKTELLITKFARIYTPAICLIALLIVVIPPLFLKAEWHQWLHRGLAALVVGCPCAIVISVPICYSAGIGACSRKHIFVKNTATLDEIDKCDTFITFEDNKSIDDIKVLQNSGAKVVYFGKGHSDVTSMESADISVAVGEDCTGEAVEVADMVMINHNDTNIEAVKHIAKKVHNIAMENIVFSILVKVVILVLDVILAKELPMWFAIFGDIGVCLIAIANSARAIALGKK